MVSPFPPDDRRVDAIRAALPATAAGIYLNTGTAGPLPAETAAAMTEASDWELRTGRGAAAIFEARGQRLEEARAAVAAILATDIDSIALTHSTSDGMNVAQWGVDWRAGDNAVVGSLDHIGGLAGLYAVRERFGTELRFASVGDTSDDDAVVAAFERLVDERTKVVSVSHVSWSTGRVLPVARIAAVAHERGALVAIDGAQAVGAIPVDPDALGADVYAFPGQKWLLGPDGMGAAWVRPSAVERIAMSRASYLSWEQSDAEGHVVPWTRARRFESSSFHVPSVVGLARSCGWLAMYVGLGWAFERAARLAALAADRLASVSGVSLVTPRASMATLVTFRIAGWPAESAIDELGRRIFTIVRSVPSLDAIRLSVAFFNTEAEIERVVRAVEELAAHTPETLPRRPALTILGEGEA